MTKSVRAICVVALLLGGCVMAMPTRHCSGGGGETFTLSVSEAERLITDRVKTLGVELGPSSMRHLNVPVRSAKFQRATLKGGGDGFADLYIESRGQKKTTVLVACRPGVENTEALAKMLFEDLRLWLTLRE